MEAINAQVSIRKGVPSDKDFILDTWCRGQYYGSPHWRQVPVQVFHKAYASHVISLLAKPSTSVAVASLADDPDTILGFIVHTGSVLHWAYTKNDFRGQGILNLLLKGKQIESVTSTTLPGAAITKKMKLTFNPFLLGE